jgi:hypothetical protein
MCSLTAGGARAITCAIPRRCLAPMLRRALLVLVCVSICMIDTFLDTYLCVDTCTDTYLSTWYVSLHVCIDTCETHIYTYAISRSQRLAPMVFLFASRAARAGVSLHVSMCISVCIVYCERRNVASSGAPGRVTSAGTRSVYWPMWQQTRRGRHIEVCLHCMCLPRVDTLYVSTPGRHIVCGHIVCVYPW